MERVRQQIQQSIQFRHQPITEITASVSSFSAEIKEEKKKIENMNWNSMKVSNRYFLFRIQNCLKLFLRRNGIVPCTSSSQVAHNSNDARARLLLVLRRQINSYAYGIGWQLTKEKPSNAYELEYTKESERSYLLVCALWLAITRMRRNHQFSTSNWISQNSKESLTHTHTHTRPDSRAYLLTRRMSSQNVHVCWIHISTHVSTTFLQRCAALAKRAIDNTRLWV